ncbi:MarR family winged helix-turn-helix transcriptional regulator [Heliophilum fasciatum]|uniref:MarR family transcriptional regulator n=1 Tax=Heliophilum fasciatum TaxID=35700 RepID=A0A4V2SWU4_9FIRM|nr:MarR family transcriptional regulator [Heliophilum fasciatum]MCW2278505.1 MarR family 2-MHQ and catechol resistance regulon transcriptional repressor [Heliophilum fasciatum]TCP63636.1 MarR family transcriptional regulator [Heliophilum fasciatum]
MNKINLKLVVAMARSYNQLFAQIEKNVQAYGFTISEFGVLELLWHKGEQPIQKVAEKILVTSGTITYIIDKLQKKDFVVRKKCAKDKRVYYVSLTPKGEEVIADIFPKHQQFIDHLLADMDDNSKKILVRSLLEMKKSIKK